jgi:hypothetical protein
VADFVSRSAQPSHAIPSAQLHGNPIKWDRIKRFTRVPHPRKPRRTSGTTSIGMRVPLNLHLNSVRPTESVNEKVLFLTKSYLDWNIATWNPLGFAKHLPRRRAREQTNLDEKGVSRLFNKCFYDAIPLLLTNRTSEAFERLSLACSLASHCLQRSPYWIFLRLLRLYSYPLWGRFPDVRRQIIAFLHALASRTLQEGHPLLPLLQLWAQEDIEHDPGPVASLLRLSSDMFGPASGLDPEEWAWIQDEICSLSYQRKEFHDALRIAKRLAEDPNVPLGVHIASLQMIARFHLQHGDIDSAKPILLRTLTLCAECSDEFERSRFLQQTFSDLGYIYHVRQDRGRSLKYYHQALERATRVKNTANMSSLRCRVETLTAEYEKSRDSSYVPTETQHAASWALWAFCRPYS